MVDLAPSGAHDDDTLEWILDSGSQVNVCGDLHCFEKLTDDKPRELVMANGTTQLVASSGTVFMRLMNHANLNEEERDVPDVYYVPGTHANLMSLDHMQTTGNFVLSMSRDQTVLWLPKPGTKLKFCKSGGLYRMCVARTRLAAYGVGSTPKESSTHPYTSASTTSVVR
ncbi:TPA: hypothetical protein N0F65_007004 [Lagenidium giganteum]|uniref:Retrovirus-related Pol polyprotein from transposon TNT 1-94-like beta-barrel domain-containing protein n=1 Tax=Lagenidium giganteum TaxID=4803 RepID=A0AAV2ZEB8_9STRA|nr:TPA: hypothetical protein N0F65_007004 [Lagenidium giganteum]